MPRVSLITVNFNQPSVTEDLLRSVKLNDLYHDLEIIVVDNGSQPDPVDRWVTRYPEMIFIRSGVNLGFAGGNNLGLKKATGDYLFFVNNDTAFTPGLTEKLVDVMERHPDTGMVSPKIRFYHTPTLIQYAGFTSMNFFTARNHCIGEFEEDNGQYDHTGGATGFIHGAAMMVRREAIEKAGMMDETFFLYYEEMDWCERIRRAGYEIKVEPHALIYHKESVSVGKKSALKEYFMNRNRILFVRRNASMLQKTVFYLYFLFLVTPRNLVHYFRDKRPDLVKPLLKAVWWNFTHKKDSNDTGYPLNTIQ